MKYLCLVVALMAISAGRAAGQDRSITDPDYELKTSGLYQIQKIEADNSAVVSRFPPLHRATTSIDFGEDGTEVIFGLSLAHTRTPMEIPETIAQWLVDETAKSKVNTLVDYASDAFFSTDTARVVGYIKGYDPRAGFSTGMIYAENTITRESHPIVVLVHEDGRFEADIPMQHPVYSGIVFERRWIRFYVEPGQTVSILLDWEEFLEADRQRNIHYQFQHVVYGGPAARVNSELLQVESPTPDYRALEQKIKQQSPADFKHEQDARWKAETAHLERTLANNDWLPQTQSLLRHELALSYANYLYDFLMNRGHYAKEDPTNEALNAPVDKTYYDFVQGLPLDDPSVLASSMFSTFVNRFEFSAPLMSRKRNVSVNAAKPFEDFLRHDRKVALSEEDEEFLAMEREVHEQITAIFNETGGQIPDSVLQSITAGLAEKSTVFYERHKDHLEVYKEYVTTHMNEQRAGRRATERVTAEWQAKDSLLQSEYGLSPNLVYEVAKVRALDFIFKNQLQAKDDARAFLTDFEDGIRHPFLIQEAERLFYLAFSDKSRQAYALPEGMASDVFKRIIDPHRGKVLFVDFWATSCAPCVASIKRHKDTRADYLGNPDLEFVFITSENESPKTTYDQFVAEQDLQFTHRIPADDFRHLRQLFNFNGIPRYVVIGSDGRVLDDDFAMHNFTHRLSSMLQLDAKQTSVSGN